MNDTALAPFLTRNGLAIAWAALLMVSLPVIFRLGLRRLESRSRAVLLGALVLLLSAGPYAAYLLDLLPRGKADAATEVRTLREKMAILDLDNVKQNDLAIAYQRENADLSQMVTRLRTQAESVETRLAELDAANRKLEERNTAYRDENSRLQKKIESLENRAQARAEAPAAPARPQEPQRTAQDRSAYTISIATPKRNLASLQSVASSLQRQGYQIQNTLPFEVTETRLVYYDPSDEAEAESIAAFLKRNNGIQVPLKLSQNRSRQKKFQLFLKP